MPVTAKDIANAVVDRWRMDYNHYRSLKDFILSLRQAHKIGASQMYRQNNYRSPNDYFELIKKVTKVPTSLGMSKLLQSFNLSKKHRKMFRRYVTKFAPKEIAVPVILKNINAKSPKEQFFLYVMLVKLRYFDAICPLVKLARSELADELYASGQLHLFLLPDFWIIAGGGTKWLKNLRQSLK